MINNVANQIAFKILMLVLLYKENYKLPFRLASEGKEYNI